MTRREQNQASRPRNSVEIFASGSSSDTPPRQGTPVVVHDGGMDSLAKAARRRIRGRKPRPELTSRDAWIVQRTYELLSAKSMAAEWFSVASCPVTEMTDSLVLIDGYFTRKQPRWTTLRSVVMNLSALLSQAAELAEDFPMQYSRAMADLALILAAQPTSSAGPLKALMASGQALVDAADPSRLHKLVDRLHELPEDVGSWSEKQWSSAERITGEVVARYIAAGLAPEGCTAVIASGCNLVALGIPMRDVLLKVMDQPVRSYVVLIPITTNKPLADLDRFQAVWIPNPSAWENCPVKGGRDRLALHLRRHFGSSPVSVIGINCLAGDQYTACRTALKDVELILDRYYASSWMLDVRVLAPQLAFELSRERALVIGHEPRSQAPLLPLEFDVIGSLGPAVRFLTAARNSSYPTLAISLAWVSLESLASEQERPFEHLYRYLPAALSLAVMRRRLAGVVKLIISETDEQTEVGATWRSLGRALRTNSAGYFDMTVVVRLLAHGTTLPPTDDALYPALLALNAARPHLSTLTARRLAEAVHYMTSGIELDRKLTQYEGHFRRVLTKMYIVRNGSFHEGKLEVNTEFALRQAAIMTADLATESAGYWVSKGPCATTSDAIEMAASFRQNVIQQPETLVQPP